MLTLPPPPSSTPSKPCGKPGGWRLWPPIEIRAEIDNEERVNGVMMIPLAGVGGRSTKRYLE